MAIYHFSAKVISRSAGSSAVASAAYRSAERLHDDRLDRDHDFTNKSGVVHSEVMLSEGAPERLGDRSTLWNEVEATELRKDAQLSREVEFAIPRELNQQQGIELARDFVQAEFVEQGMIADLNVHWDIGADGLAKPHAHVMLTMRDVNVDGFGAKVRDWNKTELLEQWRERWADHVNERLAELDIDASVDHRSFNQQGIELEPQNKIGPATSRMERDGLELERIADHAAIARRNGERIIASPNVALDAITRQQATFTKRDLAMFVHRHSEGRDQFDLAMGAVQASPDLVALGSDGHGNDRFTSRDMLEVEARLDRASQTLAERERHRVSEREKERALASAEVRGLTRASARGELIDNWDRERIANPRDSRIILTHTNEEVRQLNLAARERLRASGALGEDIAVQVERGERGFAEGDRVMFLRNDRELGVKNGSLGILQSVSAQRMAVMLDDSRSVAFDTKAYAHIDHGYAATVHKSQGVTVDRAHVLATPGMDQHSSYVALSRHRESVSLYYGKDDFADAGKLAHTLSRERAKDMASDYNRDGMERRFAERRGISFRERIAEIVRKVPEKVRGLFDGLRVQPAPAPEADRQVKAQAAVRRHARAVSTLFLAQEDGTTLDDLNAQGRYAPMREEIVSARKELNAFGANYSRDIERAYQVDPPLAHEAAGGQVRRAILAMKAEQDIRESGQDRANQFVTRWQKLKERAQTSYESGDMTRHQSARSRMAGMAEGLERDPQLESLLANRKRELGIDIASGRTLGRELAFSHGLDFGRGRGLGL